MRRASGGDRAVAVWAFVACLLAVGWLIQRPAAQVLVYISRAVSVTITAPTSNPTYDAGTSATVAVSGTATSGFAITSCAYTNSLGGSGSATVTGSGPYTWSIASVSLTVGTNVVTVTCTSSNGNTGADVISVTRSAGGGNDWSCDATSDGSDSDTQSKMDAATTGTASNPYVVCLPAGSYTWDQQVSWTAPAYAGLKGAGSGSTTITDAYNANQSVLTITTNATGYFRLTAFKVIGSSAVTTDKTSGVINISGTSTQVRIDHMEMDSTGYPNSPTTVNATAIRTFGCVKGVADNNVFLTNGAFLFDNTSCAGDDGEGDLAWNTDTNFGGSDFFYIESSTFTAANKFGSLNDCYHAAKWVTRFNTINGNGVQTHPTGGSGRARGCRATEFYANTLDDNPCRDGSGGDCLGGAPSGEQFNLYFLSSGPTMFWGNTFVGDDYKHVITLHSMRRDNSTYPQSATPGGWGYCGTSFNGTGSQWDENTSASTGYHCLDQPGMGKGDLLDGAFSAVQNVTLSCLVDNAGDPNCWPRQAVEGIYEWNNTGWVCTGCSGSFWSGLSAPDFVENELLFQDTPNFNGTTSCTGAPVCGVGSGTRASRPSSSTNGLAWWATDQGGDWNTTNGTSNDGCLDKVVGGAWSNCVYTPYTYPHPLRTTVN